MVVIQNLYSYVYIELITITLTNVGNPLYIKEFLSTRNCADSVQCQNQSLLLGQSLSDALIWSSDIFHFLVSFKLYRVSHSDIFFQFQLSVKDVNKFNDNDLTYCKINKHYNHNSVVVFSLI